MTYIKFGEFIHLTKDPHFTFTRYHGNECNNMDEIKALLIFMGIAIDKSILDLEMKIVTMLIMMTTMMTMMMTMIDMKIINPKFL